VRWSSVATCLQVLDLLAQPRQPLFDRCIGTTWLCIAQQPRQLLLDVDKARFELRIAPLRGRCPLLGLPDLLGNPGFCLALALYQQRNRLDEQAFFDSYFHSDSYLFPDIVARQV